MCLIAITFCFECPKLDFFFTVSVVSHFALLFVNMSRTLSVIVRCSRAFYGDSRELSSIAPFEDVKVM